MKKFLIMLLFLVGCAPAPAAPPTVDPNVGLALAQAEAEVYKAQLTGTAQAWSMQQNYWTATAISWTPTASLTPVPTATPSITMTPTPNVTQTMVVALANAEMTQISLTNDRESSTNKARAWLPYFVAVLALALVVFFGFVGARRLAFVPASVHEGTGKVIPLLNVVDGVVMDSDRLVNGAGQMSRKWVESLPRVTDARQDQVTAMAQAVDLQSRLGRRGEPRRVGQDQPAGLLTSEGGQMTSGMGLFPLPSWDMLNNWQGDKTLLPYGSIGTGLGLVNVDQHPHMATIGMTGTGKSRRFLRPMIACALAAGHRVVVVGKAADYFPFEGHPNMTLVRVAKMTEPGNPERYASILRALVGEMNRRDEYLSGARRSTWAQAGRENTFIILDELGNAMSLMPTGVADEVRRFVKGLVMEGRKVGFSVMIANQRATGMADIFSQMGKAVFPVERDEEKAHKSLAGASNLPQGYFYARFGSGVRLAGGFEPSDDEVVAFLDGRPVPVLDRDWVDGNVVEAFSAPVQGALPDSQPVKPDRNDISEEEVKKVVELLRNGSSPSAVVRELWDVTGGDKFLRLIKEVKGFQTVLEGA